jgi:hypothetical protein
MSRPCVTTALSGHPRGVTQAFELVLASGHGSSGGGGIGALLLILLIVWVLAR